MKRCITCVTYIVTESLIGCPMSCDLRCYREPDWLPHVILEYDGHLGISVRSSLEVDLHLKHAHLIYVKADLSVLLQGHLRVGELKCVTLQWG